ncbi:protoporphyrinogen oxidase HemJ [Endothiovibrio diazotrophicus]
MLWVKAFHIIAVVTWFAGLFYLPRLFVYHAMCEDTVGDERFKVMERKLYHGIMTPSLIVVVGLGLWMLFDYAWEAYRAMLWLHIKLTIALLLIGYHLYCGHLVKRFRDGRNTRSHVFYRWFNEAPVLALVSMVVLAVVKPF